MKLSHPVDPRQRGFSLLEMVLVIVLMALLAGLGSRLLSVGFDSYFTARDHSDADWQGRYAWQRLSRELRTVRSPSAADLVMAPANQVTFTTLAGDTVSYALAGNTLNRNGIPLADGISGLSFSYLQRDGKSVAADATQVFYIVVDYSVARSGNNYSVRALVRPRTFP